MSYQMHLDTLLKRSRAEQEAYEKKRNAQAASAAQQIDRLYDDIITSAEKEYQATAAATAAGYRQSYDANAVSELVARRHATEAVANYNAANSGLNNTQQTAISLMRGNADAQTTLQKQAAVDSIMRELDSLRAKYQTESANRQATIYQDALDDAAEYMMRREEAARDDAYKLYKQDNEVRKAAYEALKESGGGTRYAVKNTPSELQIRSDAMSIRKKQGDAFADIYLTQCMNRGYITPVQKAEIMKKMDMPEVVRPTEAEVRAEVDRLLKEKGKYDANLYITTLYNTGMIFVRLREKMYDVIEKAK